MLVKGATDVWMTETSSCLSCHNHIQRRRCPNIHQIIAPNLAIHISDSLQSLRALFRHCANDGVIKLNGYGKHTKGHFLLHKKRAWWHHQKGNIFRVTGYLCGVTGEFPAQRPVTRSFNVFFYLRLNKRLSKQWGGWWFETPSRLLWRNRNEAGLVVNEKISVVNYTKEFSSSLAKPQLHCNGCWAKFW